MRKGPARKLARNSTTGQFLDRGIAGVAADGVVIRKSPGRATHFTQREVERAVATVLAAGKQGKNGAKEVHPKKG